MHFELAYDEELQIIELTFHGDITAEDIHDTATAVARVAKEKGSHKLLTDCRDARLRMNTFQIHEVPGKLPEIVGAQGVDVQLIRRALVVEQDLEDFKFFETVAVNRGQAVKVFTDMAEARRWLVGTGAEASFPVPNGTGMRDGGWGPPPATANLIGGPMQYDLNYDEELGIVELTLRGDIVFAQIDDSVTAAGRLAKEKGSDKLLTDCRQARLRMNTLQIHEVPGRISELLGARGLDVPYLRCALVATEDLKDFEFFETVSLNRGQPVKLFTDIDEARRWLIGAAAGSR